ncbi:hypothetical protein GG804_17450 [Sphingomonas histidinilytica]|jgi:hypothetical protein|uniref:Uncharacterized protein n=1 Tax=Rhizorhabdus histidinilytica TaxID=439228 RepID=A0A1T5EAS8_9SPHN|nr:hypothetical protein [Rhizorhabdus histidinilytica]MBO9378557.1 hypothetical protein [Rhizorhabdus histidinilytica]QEH80520.1 hypothetical protein EIK56_21295 [Sphingomonas sp. C8-2]SKB80976.1 hypothetical protein SAMN06295920_106321 [Rhizorhabdus histidinilytica]
MKAAWAIGGAFILSAPIMALPTRWSAEADVARYLVGDLGRRGSHVLIACPADGSPAIQVAIAGAGAPPGSDVGFRSGDRTVVMHADGDGMIATRDHANAAAFGALWRAIRAGDRLDIGFTNGVSASLPLKGEARALPAAPCDT